MTRSTTRPAVPARTVTPAVGGSAGGTTTLHVPDGADSPAVVALAWLSRLATFIFIIYYTALDAIGGFGLARTIMITKALTNS